MPTTDRIEQLLRRLRDGHVLPGPVTERLMAVGNALVTGEPPEEIADLLVAAGAELAQALPQGEELSEGLHRLADAAEGLPGDASARLRDLALAAGPVPGPGATVEARLRLLLEARRHLGRAAPGGSRRRYTTESTPFPASFKDADRLCRDEPTLRW